MSLKVLGKQFSYNLRLTSWEKDSIKIFYRSVLKALRSLEKFNRKNSSLKTGGSLEKVI